MTLHRAAALLLALCAAPALGDVFSPGPLSSAHATLEGIKNCTQCHIAGGQLSEQRCLDCHSELKTRVAQHQGLHGRLRDSERNCASCHHEHQGRKVALVDWGTGGKEKFDHARTGFPLLGKHAQARCDQCHVDRFITDPAVQKIRASHPEHQTFLGVAVTCATCHFDEHRGQLSQQCRDCHVEKAWKPAPGFSHAKTDFLLEGKHREVACLKCHARSLDIETPSKSKIGPVGESFSRFKPVAHASCVDCHKDPHENRFGQDCKSCHTVEGWTSVRQVDSARAFHQKTKFPLQGAHAQVACKACHGPGPDGPAVFKGLRFDTCNVCHVDAHLGQVGTQTCDRCHSVQSFLPARFEVADHQKAFPLEGAHAAVACLLCHKADANLALRATPLRAWLSRRGRRDAVSVVSFHPQGKPSRCDTCHANPHGAQFQDRVTTSGCTDCHVVSSFSAVRFDHATTRFPLTGKHMDLPCASCHLADGSGAVRYRPLEVACASCHGDVHAGQFAKAGVTDCTRCHKDTGFKPSTFEHRAPFTTFALEGKHATLSCASCHREIAAGRDAHVTRYKGVPQACAGCHVDVHRGAFAGFEQ